MNVLMISDDNYAFLLAASILSLFDSNRDATELRVYIISDGIKKKSIEAVEKIADQFKRELYWLPVPEMPEGIVMKGSLNISTYYRLMMQSVIPEIIEKILYLDCDILVRGNIENLWEIDIKDYYLAGVTDTTGKFARESVGLKKNDKYVNAGVLLINLKKWRENQTEEKFLSYLESKNWKVEFNDQGVINRVCNSGIKLVNPQYNMMPTYQRYSHKELKRLTELDKFYTEEEIERAKREPRIIHYAGYAFSRPWFKDAKGQYNEEFIEYLRKTGINFEYKNQPSGFKYRVRRAVNAMNNGSCILANKIIDKIYEIKEGI